MASSKKIVCIVISSMICMMSNSLISPLYPVIAAERKINELIVGIIFSISAVSSVVSSIFIGRKIETLGRRNTLSLGLLLLVVYLLAISFSVAFNNITFIVISLIARIFFGAAVACIYISGLSIISIESGDKKEFFCSALEAFAGLGLILGPLYATNMHSLIGFSGMMILFAAFIFILIPEVWFYTKPRVIYDTQVNEAKPSSKISRNMMLDMLICTYCYAAFTYFEPSIGPHFEKLGLDEIEIGWIFALMSGSYAIFNILMTWVLHLVSPLKLVPLSAVICSFSLLVVSVSGDRVYMGIAGVAICGIGTAMSFVSALISMLDDLTRSGQFTDSNSDKISSFFNISLNFGEIFGPLMSGAIGIFGFSGTCFIISGIGAVLTLVSLNLKSFDYSKKVCLLQDKENEFLNSNIS